MREGEGGWGVPLLETFPVTLTILWVGYFLHWVLSQLQSQHRLFVYHQMSTPDSWGEAYEVGNLLNLDHVSHELQCWFCLLRLLFMYFVVNSNYSIKRNREVDSCICWDAVNPKRYCNNYNFPRLSFIIFTSEGTLFLFTDKFSTLNLIDYC